MAEKNISSAVASDLANQEIAYSVDPISTDAGGDQKEYTWQNTEWTQQLGYYKEIPELNSAVDAKVNWIMGAGFKSDKVTTLHLMTIKGHGKDSFNSILRNAITVCILAGDSFTEAIRDKSKKKILVNLKPLDPSSMRIVSNDKGRIIRYEQTSKVRGVKSWKKFKPEQILHLSRNRIADEVHGISIIKAVKWIIDARNEAMADMRKLMHRHVIPRFMYQLDTDDPAEIAAIKAKEDKANAQGENLYIPKGSVEADVISVSPNETLNPLAWIDKLNDYFYQVVNVPQIIVGNAKEFTDASGKIVYLSYEQSVKGGQLYVEEQVLNQLNIEINLEFPASLQNDTISEVEDNKKKEPTLTAAQPSDTTAKLGGK